MPLFENIIITPPKEGEELTPVQRFVKETIGNGRIVIFSKTVCPYCIQAKRIFRDMEENIQAIELDKRDDGPLIQEYLGTLTGASTVPRVFVKGRSIGGAMDLNLLFNSGRLKKLLKHD